MPGTVLRALWILTHLTLSSLDPESILLREERELEFKLFWIIPKSRISFNPHFQITTWLDFPEDGWSFYLGTIKYVLGRNIRISRAWYPEFLSNCSISWKWVQSALWRWARGTLSVAFWKRTLHSLCVKSAHFPW